MPFSTPQRSNTNGSNWVSAVRSVRIFYVVLHRCAGTHTRYNFCSSTLMVIHIYSCSLVFSQSLPGSVRRYIAQSGGELQGVSANNTLDHCTVVSSVSLLPCCSVAPLWLEYYCRPILSLLRMDVATHATSSTMVAECCGICWPHLLFTRIPIVVDAAVAQRCGGRSSGKGNKS